MGSHNGSIGVIARVAQFFARYSLLGFRVPAWVRRVQGLM